MIHSTIKILLVTVCCCVAACQGEAGPGNIEQTETSQPADTRLFKVDAPKITEVPELKPLEETEVEIHSIEGEN
jgi:hypothetical protein